MAASNCARCLYICAIILYGLTEDVATEQINTRPHFPSPDFSHHGIIEPKVYHTRSKRHITNTAGEDGLHLQELHLGYTLDGQEHVLELRLNRELVGADFFIKYQHLGGHAVNKPTHKEVDLCQYVGTVRGMDNSWAALSTCRGLRGVVYDGKTMHYLQPQHEDVYRLDAPHFLYKHHHLVSNHTCGYVGSSLPFHTHSPSHSAADINFKQANRMLRYKRSVGKEAPIRQPYNANKQSRYVELVMVVDHKEYKELGEDVAKVHQHCKDIANIINMLYTPLNIFIALVGVVVWSDHDEISLSENGDTTLTNFLHYRREILSKQHPNDNAQLLTREKFTGGVVGKALKGPICTFEFSGGVNMDHSNVVGLVATTIAHEIGHNFGMEHDTEDCACPDERCIMCSASTSLSPAHWSSCSMEYLALAYEHGMDYCLRNKPLMLFDSPVCGNGFVEPGEQCDCGMGEACRSNHCCDPNTCMLFPNATCATGECCQKDSCRPSPAGTLCRSADHECDLPEYCTGHSEFCPSDVFKMDTHTCDNGKAFCYQGSCRTRTDQCRLLWGPSGESSDDHCYEMNKKGTRHGNCGYDRFRQKFSTCSNDSVFCGMLHCKHLNERLEFGMESVAILSHTFINSKGSIIPCRTAIVDLGIGQMDPGLVPDGAKCGEGKMCVNQKCMAVASLRLGARAAPEDGSVCPSDCSGHGVCNSLGHCHCELGFNPPLCQLPGPGGSVDSGPAQDPNAQRRVTTVIFTIFLGIVPLLVLLMMLVYYVRHNACFWWRQPKGGAPIKSVGPLVRGMSRGASCLGLCAPPSSPPPALSPSSGCPTLGPDDMSSSLLPTAPNTSQPNNFFGHFKGFTLAPIGKQEPEPNFTTFSPTSPGTSKSVRSITNAINNKNTTVQSPSSGQSAANHTAQINRSMSSVTPQSPNSTAKLPQRTAPPVPTVPNVAIKIPNAATLNRAATSVGSNATRPKSVVFGVENSNCASMAPALPPLNPGLQNSRPIISNPILEASTCTAKELISPLKNSSGTGGAVIVPLREAPAAPVSPTASKRPLSSPNSTVNSVFKVPEEPAIKKQKEGTTTLNRIASFLKQDKEKTRNPVERSNSLPKNPNHQVKVIKTIDKNALRNLQISNPILQKDIDLPSSTVPCVSDSEDLEDTNKMVVMRAQSMRGPALAPRPNIPTFGSMRQASGVKRPTSIPTGNRPTSPPPPRPDQVQETTPKGKLNFIKKIPGMPGYQNPPIPVKKDYNLEYDDCVAETHAPLANISEETSPDNIYAIIEESPPNDKRKNNPGTPLSIDGTKRIGGVVSTSTESMGLLGEIVSEIQNRNFDSIYSTSTLARKKKEKEMRDAGKKVPSEEDGDFDDGAYANESHYKSPNSEYSNLSGGMKNISSAASTTSSGYLNPAAVNVPVGNIPPKSGIVSVNNSKPEDVKTDGYKPFSSTLHRSLGPFASSYTKEKTPDATKQPEKVVSPTESAFKSKVPALTRQTTPDKLLNRNVPSLSRQITPPHLKNITAAQKSLQGVANAGKSNPMAPKNLPKIGNKPPSPVWSVNNINSPDLVSSCAGNSSSPKSPDVVSSNGQNDPPKVSAVNQGVILKPTMPKSTFNQFQKPPPPNLAASKVLNKVTPKPGTNVNSSVTDNKTVLRNAPPPPSVSNLNDKKKVVPPRPSLPKVIQNSAPDKSIPTSNLNSVASKSNSFEKNLNKVEPPKNKPVVAKNSVAVAVKVDAVFKNQNGGFPPKSNLVPKASNVANLQQKFEASKAGNGAKNPR